MNTRAKIASKPRLLGSEDVVCVDVDDTLIMWYIDDVLEKHQYKMDPAQYAIDLKDLIVIEDPYIPGHYETLAIHHRHVNLVKRLKAQGNAIVVWSYGGEKWAQTIVEALGLSEHVDFIMPKPAEYVDDTPMAEWQPKRIYLHKKFQEKG